MQVRDAQGIKEITAKAVVLACGKAMPFCQPKEGITIDQARRIFLKYIAAHPEDLHWTAQTILAVALNEIFPCDPLRALSDKVENRIAAAMNGGSGEVVELNGAKR